MKPKMFRFQLSLAGVGANDIESIERWIVDHESPFSNEEIRDAVFEYTKICMDLKMIPRYIVEVEYVAMRYCIGFPESTKVVSDIIASWSGR